MSKYKIRDNPEKGCCGDRWRKEGLVTGKEGFNWQGASQELFVFGVIYIIDKM